MATADISKQSVFDARIIQQSPAYAVNKGALSLTAVPFQAISQTSSQHTYNCVIPSQNVFIDRALDWQSTFGLAVPVGAITTPRGVNEPILSLGKDVALTNFPLQSMCQTTTATINDTTVTMNTSDVVKEVLRLTSFASNKKSRTCPTKDDTYASYNDGYVSINSPLAGYSEAYDPYNVGNGAFPGVVYCNPTNGAILTGNNTYADPNGVTVTYVDGIPIRTVASDAGCVLGLKVTSVEKLVLSPFVFANAHEWETGLFGINAIQLVMNLNPVAVQRVLRSTTASGRTLGTVGFIGNAFTGSQVLIQILTPSLDVPLPPKSVVPYMEFPRYLTNVDVGATGLTAGSSVSIPGGSKTSQVYGGATFEINSQTIVLPQIPDMLIIYAKPSSYANTTFGDYHFAPCGININFDNFAGLLSSHSQNQLYQMSVHNGLDMDWSQWSGVGYTGQNGKRIGTSGGFLVLRPGQDFALQSGQAPGLAGNFVLQYNLTCQNNSPLDLVAGGPSANVSLYTIAVNAGFFESMAGSSRIVKSVLSEADIISAEPTAEGSRDDLKRVVGSGFIDNLGSMLHRARKGTAESKEGKGSSGGASAGGAITGGRTKKMSLSARLM